VRYFSRLSLPILVLLLTAVPLGIFAKPARADTTGFLNLINSYRQQNGKAALSEDQNLTNAACWFASDMAVKNYFPADHVDSQGRTMSQRLTDFGVSGSRAENIFSTTAGSSANYAFDAWKNSSGHNANMLSSTYSRIGIGRANNGNKWYWVTDFANGGATGLTNQCGIAVNQPQPPAPQPPPAPAKNPPPPPAIPVETPKVETLMETPVATTAATISAIPTATRSATKASGPKNTVGKVERKGPTMIQGIAAGSLILGNILIFSFVAFQLYRHHKFN
jgi:hypothetical protein